MKKPFLPWSLITTLVFMIGFGSFLPARAVSPGSVVVNEVSWAGSVDSANDEWIELFNTSDQAIDLTGWVIDDDQGASLYQLSGSIAPYGYFLIEDSQDVVLPNVADLLINISLSNTGDSLTLKDQTGQIIDAVNTSGGAWFAGNATSRSSMERVNASTSGDLATNWISSSGAGSIATSQSGVKIIGTPGVLNSGSQAPVMAQKVLLSFDSQQLQVGQTVHLQVRAENVHELFSYGIELLYDPAVFDFQQVLPGTFLSQNGAVSTSLQGGLENGLEGKLIVAEARTQQVKTGVSGTGDLFQIQFKVIGSPANQPSTVTIGNGSFLANTDSDLLVQFSSGEAQFGATSLGAVSGLSAQQDLARYAMKISWNPVSEADGYEVYRKDSHGVWKLMGQVNTTTFVDQDGVSFGGNIVPYFQYEYQVIAFHGTLKSSPALIQGIEQRGIKGDNNRSDRVDGRDLESLARIFAITDSEASFDPLVDTTYDGEIDGSDLIDLGMNFAKTYS